jgi:hypothetical protein
MSSILEICDNNSYFASGFGLRKAYLLDYSGLTFTYFHYG